MKKLLTLLFTVITFNIFGQTPTYIDSVYPVNIQTNIQYGKARNAFHLNQPLYTDIYSPIGLDTVNKPTVLLAHGGGFVGGSKNDTRLVAEAKYLAGCGYVVFCYDYRLGWKLNINDTLQSIKNSHIAYYRAVQDGFTLVRFAKYYSNVYHIDTSNVFIGGTSAGGMIAVGVGYLDQTEVEPFFTSPLKTNGNTITQYTSTNVKGVISYWGGGFDTTIFQADEPDNICFHGTNDKVVYYNYGKFKGIIPIYGGFSINRESEQVGINSILHTFIGAGHGVLYPSLNWDSCVSETVGWLHEKLFTSFNLNSIPQPSTTPRLVLSELICSLTCSPCTIFDPTFRTLMNTNSSKVVYTERHTNIPSADAYYIQGSPYTQWYKSFNGIVANPVFYWDGKFHFTNDANQACFDSIQAKPAYLIINSTFHLNATKDSIFVETNLTPLANISGDLYLHTNIKFGSPGNYNAYAFSGKLGETSIPDLIANQSTTYQIAQAIPTTYTLGYDKDSLKVLVYVQSHINSNPIVNDPPTHEVFNSAYAVKQSTTYPVLSIIDAQTGLEICPISGWISQTTNGGLAPYTYIWNNGLTTEDIADLIHGNYSCTVISSDGQSLVTSYTINSQALGNISGVSITPLSNVKIKVTCFTVPYANKYQFQIRKVGVTTWTNKEVNTPSVQFTGLTPNTAYEIRVRARCKTGTIYKNSLWSSIYTTNTPMRMENILKEGTLYIYDVMGREVYRGVDAPDYLPDGIYIFKQDNIIQKHIIIN